MARSVELLCSQHKTYVQTVKQPIVTSGWILSMPHAAEKLAEMACCLDSKFVLTLSAVTTPCQGISNSQHKLAV